MTGKYREYFKNFFGFKRIDVIAFIYKMRKIVILCECNVQKNTFTELRS